VLHPVLPEKGFHLQGERIPLVAQQSSFKSRWLKLKCNSPAWTNHDARRSLYPFGSESLTDSLEQIGHAAGGNFIGVSTASVAVIVNAKQAYFFGYNGAMPNYHRSVP
jgi:hypothetical protein